MKRVVNNHSVEKYFVLYWCSATNVKLPSLVAGGDDTRENLQVLRQVRFSANGWNLFDFFRCDLGDRNLDLGFLFFVCSRHFHGFEFDGRFFKVYFFGDDISCFQRKGLPDAVKADGGYHQCIITRRNLGDGKVPIEISLCTKRSSFQIDTCINCRF